jgi:hypothetical protein
MLLAGIMLLSGCTSALVKDISVEAQADPKTSFSGYKTYAWLGSAAILSDPHGQWEPPEFDADAEIKYLIDRELRKRGMMPNYANPDLLVAFAAGIDMEALKLKVDPETKISALEKVPAGGLVVLFVDGQSGIVNWVAVATGEVQQSPNTKTVKARLDYAVTQMFKKLPK